MNNLLIPNTWKQSNNASVKAGTNSFSIGLKPSELSLVENNISFQYLPIIANNNALKSKLVIRIIGNIPDQTTFVITTQFITIKLRASLSPTVNEFVTSAFSGATYQMNTVEAIANELLSSQLLINYYNVWTNGNEIHIEAKEYGNVYDLTYVPAPTPPSPISNFQVVLNQSGQDKFNVDSAVDYELFADIFIIYGDYGSQLDKNNGIYVDTLYYPFTGSNIEFNINNLINDYVDIQLPTKRSDTFANLVELDKIVDVNNQFNKHLIAYFIVWGDSYRFQINGDRKRTVQGVSEVLWVQNGGTNSLNPYDLSKYVWNNNINPFNFLTNCPNEKEVSYNSIEFLQFIRKKQQVNNGFEYGRTLKVNYVDGSTTSLDTTIGSNWINLSNNLSMDVSPSNLNIEGLETSNGTLVDSYEVSFYYKLSNAGNTPIYRSEVKKYKMRRKCNEQSFNLLFINRLGGWDTLELRGDYDVTNDRKSTSFQRNIPILTNRTSTVSYEEMLTTKINFKEIFSLNSGYISNSHYKWTSELLSSSAVFIWDNVLRQFRSIIIESSNYSYNNKDGEFNLNVVLRYSGSEMTITR